MFTKPRLDLFKSPSLGQRFRNAIFKTLFGMVPAAAYVNTIHTRLDRSGFAESKKYAMRIRSAWNRGHQECFAAFVSYLNHCKF